MAYELPLAQFLGLEGIALLRAFNGEYGQDFLEARIEEIRRMLDDPALNRAGEDVEKFDTVTGYKGWAATYDTTTSDVIRYEEPVIDRMLKGLPPGAGPRWTRAAGPAGTQRVCCGQATTSSGSTARRKC